MVLNSTVRSSNAAPAARVFSIRALLALFTTALLLLKPWAARGQGAADPLIGIWVLDEGFQTLELLFRPDGHYQLDTRNPTDPVVGSFAERGTYQVSGGTLTLTPHDYLGEPENRGHDFEISGQSLTLTRVDLQFSQVFQFRPESRNDVLTWQQAPSVLIGKWRRNITFAGTEEYTFRPGGYYVLKYTPEGDQLPPEFTRGRYEQAGGQLTIMPYGGTPAQFALDFFNTTLTLIENLETFARSMSYEKVAGSEAEVRQKETEAEAFLSRENWQVGIWEIREEFQTVDLTIRPDGHYIARTDSDPLRGIVRGRYVLEPDRIQFLPFVGQGIYSPSNGDFGKVERTRLLDYYENELQLIDTEALSDAVTLARKRAGSESAILEKVAEAEAVRENAEWPIGIWEVNDPTGWMEFTFRPDNRYIVKAGASGVPSEVERGRYLFTTNKLTLAPYPGYGGLIQARGFELDLYEGDLFLVGDPTRMVIARKGVGSEVGVIEKTLHPDAVLGERGSILGRWTANLPGQFSELVFRPDGEFRLTTCANGVISRDYGLFSADISKQTLISDSRFVPIENDGLDFYDGTMTVFGGLGAPRTYSVNLGTVDAAIATSMAADAEEEQVDAVWLARVGLGPRNPNVGPVPGGDLPADPNPGVVFDGPTVFDQYRLYRSLIPGFAYFNVNGTIKSVPVTHTREWHFFPNGRVLVRFTNEKATFVYPITDREVSDAWGAFRIEPKPVETDVLHRYADNSLFIETDPGEQMEMTLENGRRNLFWGKEYMLLSDWAAEQQSIPCELPENPDRSLMNTGVSLTTSIAPDIGGAPPVLVSLSGPVDGRFTVNGASESPATLVTERATGLKPPVMWESVQTNTVSGGPFTYSIAQGSSPAEFFRVRVQ